MPVVVEIELGDTIVVGDEEIGIACAAQIGCRAGQRPAAAADASLRAHFFKVAVAEIVEEIFAAAVFRVLKAVGHHARVAQVPQVHIFRIVTADEEIELAIVVVIEPDGGVGVDPRRQPGLFAHAREVFALVVVK